MDILTPYQADVLAQSRPTARDQYCSLLGSYQDVYAEVQRLLAEAVPPVRGLGDAFHAAMDRERDHGQLCECGRDHTQDHLSTRQPTDKEIAEAAYFAAVESELAINGGPDGSEDWDLDDVVMPGPLPGLSLPVLGSED